MRNKKNINNLMPLDDRLTMVYDGTCKRYYNSDGLLHRYIGPAVVFQNGDNQTWKEGILISSFEKINGLQCVKSFYQDGNIRYERWEKDFRLHREDGPALIDMESNLKEWWFNGQLHRVDGPAQIKENLARWWYKGKEYTKEKYFRMIKKKYKERAIFSEDFITF